MDDLLDDMGDKWQTLTKNQKIALAQTVAGTRQYTQLVALMDNWDVMQQNLTYAREATGSLQEQQDKYMESTEAHLNKLTASTERFMDALIDDKAVNNLIDALTSITDLLGNFIEGIGGGSSAMLMLGSIGTKVFSKQIAEGLAVTAANLRSTKKEAEEITTAFENLESFKYFAEKSDTVVPGILSKFQSVSSMMSNADIKHVNEYTQMLSYYEDLEKAATSAKTHAADMMKDFNMPVQGGFLDAGDEYDLKAMNEGISRSAKTASESLIKLKASMGALYDSKDSQSLKNLITDFESAKGQMQTFADSYGNAFEQEQITEIDLNIRKLDEFIARLKELNNEADEGAGDQVSGKIAEITQEEGAALYKSMLDYTQASGNALVTVQKKGSYVFEQLGKDGVAAYEKLTKESRQATDELMSGLNRFLDRLKDSKEIESFVVGLSGIGELASGLMTLSNLDNI